LTDEQLENERKSSTKDDGRDSKREKKDRRKSADAALVLGAGALMAGALAKEHDSSKRRSSEYVRDPPSQADDREAEIERQLKELYEEKRRQEERKRTLEQLEHTQRSESTEKAISNTGAGKRSSSSEDSSGPRRKSSLKQSKARETSPGSDTQQERIARMAAQRVKSTPSPSHENYGNFFVPQELVEHLEEHNEKAEHRDDMGANVVEIIPGGSASKRRNPFDPFLYRPFGFEDDDDPSLHPWPVPRLELVEATPPGSRTHSDRGDTTPVIRPSSVEPPDDVGEPLERKASNGTKVTWGDHDTYVYEVQTPEYERSDYIPDTETSSHKGNTKEEPEVSQNEKHTDSRPSVGRAWTLDDAEAAVLEHEVPTVSERPHVSRAWTVDDQEAQQIEHPSPVDRSALVEDVPPHVIEIKPRQTEPDLPRQAGSESEDTARGTSAAESKVEPEREFYQSPLAETASDLDLSNNQHPQQSGLQDKSQDVQVDLPDVRLSKSEKRRLERASSSGEYDTERGVSPAEPHDRATGPEDRESVFDFLVDDTGKSMVTAAAGIATGAILQAYRSKSDLAEHDDSQSTAPVDKDAGGRSSFKRASTFDDSTTQHQSQSRSKTDPQSDPEDWERSRTPKKGKKSKRSAQSDIGINDKRSGKARDEEPEFAKPRRSHTESEIGHDLDDRSSASSRKRKSKRSDEANEETRDESASRVGSKDNDKSRRKSKRDSQIFDDDETHSVASSPADPDKRNKDKERKASGGFFSNIFSTNRSDVSTSSKRSSKSSKSESRADRGGEEGSESRKKHRSRDQDLDDVASAISEPVRSSKRSSERRHKDTPEKPSSRDESLDNGFVSAEESTEARAHEEDKSFLVKRPEMPQPTDIAMPMDTDGVSGLASEKESPDTPINRDRVIESDTETASRPSAALRRLSAIRTRESDSSPTTPNYPTSIPVHFRLPVSSPIAPRFTMSSPVASPASPLATPRTRQGRPKSTEFPGKNIRPLYLVEVSNSSKIPSPDTSDYPPLPASIASSSHSSTEDLRVEAQAQEQQDIFTPSRLSADEFRDQARRQSYSYWHDGEERRRSPDYLDSRSATPVPGEAQRARDRENKPKPKYEFHSPSELLQDPSLLYGDEVLDDTRPGSPLPSVVSTELDYMSARSRSASPPRARSLSRGRRSASQSRSTSASWQDAVSTMAVGAIAGSALGLAAHRAFSEPLPTDTETPGATTPTRTGFESRELASSFKPTQVGLGHQPSEDEGFSHPSEIDVNSTQGDALHDRYPHDLSDQNHDPYSEPIKELNADDVSMSQSPGDRLTDEGGLPNLQEEQSIRAPDVNAPSTGDVETSHQIVAEEKETKKSKKDKKKQRQKQLTSSFNEEPLTFPSDQSRDLEAPESSISRGAAAENLEKAASLDYFEDRGKLNEDVTFPALTEFQDPSPKELSTDVKQIFLQSGYEDSRMPETELTPFEQALEAAVQARGLGQGASMAEAYDAFQPDAPKDTHEDQGTPLTTIEEENEPVTPGVQQSKPTLERKSSKKSKRKDKRTANREPVSETPTELVIDSPADMPSVETSRQLEQAPFVQTTAPESETFVNKYRSDTNPFGNDFEVTNEDPGASIRPEVTLPETTPVVHETAVEKALPTEPPDRPEPSQDADVWSMPTSKKGKRDKKDKKGKKRQSISWEDSVDTDEPTEVRVPGPSTSGMTQDSVVGENASLVEPQSTDTPQTGLAQNDTQTDSTPVETVPMQGKDVAQAQESLQEADDPWEMSTKKGKKPKKSKRKSLTWADEENLSTSADAPAEGAVDHSADSRFGSSQSDSILGMENGATLDEDTLQKPVVDNAVNELSTQFAQPVVAAAQEPETNAGMTKEAQDVIEAKPAPSKKDEVERAPEEPFSIDEASSTKSTKKSKKKGKKRDSDALVAAAAVATAVGVAGGLAAEHLHADAPDSKATVGAEAEAALDTDGAGSSVVDAAREDPRKANEAMPVGNLSDPSNESSELPPTAADNVTSTIDGETPGSSRDQKSDEQRLEPTSPDQDNEVTQSQLPTESPAVSTEEAPEELFPVVGKKSKKDKKKRRSTFDEPIPSAVDEEVSTTAADNVPIGPSEQDAEAIEFKPSQESPAESAEQEPEDLFPAVSKKSKKDKKKKRQSTFDDSVTKAVDENLFAMAIDPVPIESSERDIKASLLQKLEEPLAPTEQEPEDLFPVVSKKPKKDKKKKRQSAFDEPVADTVDEEASRAAPDDVAAGSLDDAVTSDPKAISLESQEPEPVHPVTQEPVDDDFGFASTKKSKKEKKKKRQSTYVEFETPVDTSPSLVEPSTVTPIEDAPEPPAESADEKIDLDQQSPPAPPDDEFATIGNRSKKDKQRKNASAAQADMPEQTDALADTADADTPTAPFTTRDTNSKAEASESRQIKDVGQEDPTTTTGPIQHSTALPVDTEAWVAEPKGDLRPVERFAVETPTVEPSPEAPIVETPTSVPVLDDPQDHLPATKNLEEDSHRPNIVVEEDLGTDLPGTGSLESAEVSEPASGLLSQPTYVAAESHNDKLAIDDSSSPQLGNIEISEAKVHATGDTLGGQQDLDAGVRDEWTVTSKKSKKDKKKKQQKISADIDKEEETQDPPQSSIEESPSEPVSLPPADQSELLETDEVAAPVTNQDELPAEDDWGSSTKKSKKEKKKKRQFLLASPSNEPETPINDDASKSEDLLTQPMATTESGVVETPSDLAVQEGSSTQPQEVVENDWGFSSKKSKKEKKKKSQPLLTTPPNELDNSTPGTTAQDAGIPVEPVIMDGSDQAQASSDPATEEGSSTKPDPAVEEEWGFSTKKGKKDRKKKRQSGIETSTPTNEATAPDTLASTTPAQIQNTDKIPQLDDSAGSTKGSISGMLCTEPNAVVDQKPDGEADEELWPVKSKKSKKDKKKSKFVTDLPTAENDKPPIKADAPTEDTSSGLQEVTPEDGAFLSANEDAPAEIDPIVKPVLDQESAVTEDWGSRVVDGEPGVSTIVDANSVVETTLAKGREDPANEGPAQETVQEDDAIFTTKKSKKDKKKKKLQYNWDDESNPLDSTKTSDERSASNIDAPGETPSTKHDQQHTEEAPTIASVESTVQKPLNLENSRIDGTTIDLVHDDSTKPGQEISEGDSAPPELVGGTRGPFDIGQQNVDSPGSGTPAQEVDDFWASSSKKSKKDKKKSRKSIQSSDTLGPNTGHEDQSQQIESMTEAQQHSEPVDKPSMEETKPTERSEAAPEDEWSLPSKAKKGSKKNRKSTFDSTFEAPVSSTTPAEATDQLQTRVDEPQDAKVDEIEPPAGPLNADADETWSSDKKSKKQKKRDQKSALKSSFEVLTLAEELKDSGSGEEATKMMSPGVDLDTFEKDESAAAAPIEDDWAPTKKSKKDKKKNRQSTLDELISNEPEGDQGMAPEHETIVADDANITPLSSVPDEGAKPATTEGPDEEWAPSTKKSKKEKKKKRQSTVDEFVSGEPASDEGMVSKNQPKVDDGDTMMTPLDSVADQETKLGETQAADEDEWAPTKKSKKDKKKKRQSTVNEFTSNESDPATIPAEQDQHSVDQGATMTGPYVSITEQETSKPATEVAGGDEWAPTKKSKKDKKKKRQSTFDNNLDEVDSGTPSTGGQINDEAAVVAPTSIDIPKITSEEAMAPSETKDELVADPHEHASRTLVQPSLESQEKDLTSVDLDSIELVTESSPNYMSTSNRGAIEGVPNDQPFREDLPSSTDLVEPQETSVNIGGFAPIGQETTGKNVEVVVEPAETSSMAMAVERISSFLDDGAAQVTDALQSPDKGIADDVKSTEPSSAEPDFEEATVKESQPEPEFTTPIKKSKKDKRKKRASNFQDTAEDPEPELVNEPKHMAIDTPPLEPAVAPEPEAEFTILSKNSKDKKKKRQSTFDDAFTDQQAMVEEPEEDATNPPELMDIDTRPADSAPAPEPELEFMVPSKKSKKDKKKKRQSAFDYAFTEAQDLVEEPKEAVINSPEHMALDAPPAEPETDCMVPPQKSKKKKKRESGFDDTFADQEGMIQLDPPEQSATVEPEQQPSSYPVQRPPRPDDVKTEESHDITDEPPQTDVLEHELSNATQPESETGPTNVVTGLDSKEEEAEQFVNTPQFADLSASRSLDIPGEKATIESGNPDDVAVAESEWAFSKNSKKDKKKLQLTFNENVVKPHEDGAVTWGGEASTKEAENMPLDTQLETLASLPDQCRALDPVAQEGELGLPTSESSQHKAPTEFEFETQKKDKKKSRQSTIVQDDLEPQQSREESTEASPHEMEQEFAKISGEITLESRSRRGSLDETDGIEHSAKIGQHRGLDGQQLNEKDASLTEEPAFDSASISGKNKPATEENSTLGSVMAAAAAAATAAVIEPESATPSKKSKKEKKKKRQSVSREDTLDTSISATPFAGEALFEDIQEQTPVIDNPAPTEDWGFSSKKSKKNKKRGKLEDLGDDVQTSGTGTPRSTDQFDTAVQTPSDQPISMRTVKGQEGTIDTSEKPEPSAEDYFPAVDRKKSKKDKKKKKTSLMWAEADDQAPTEPQENTTSIPEAEGSPLQTTTDAKRHENPEPITKLEKAAPMVSSSEMDLDDHTQPMFHEEADKTPANESHLPGTSDPSYEPQFAESSVDIVMKPQEESPRDEMDHVEPSDRFGSVQPETTGDGQQGVKLTEKSPVINDMEPPRRTKSKKSKKEKRIFEFNGTEMIDPQPFKTEDDMVSSRSMGIPTDDEVHPVDRSIESSKDDGQQIHEDPETLSDVSATTRERRKRRRSPPAWAGEEPEDLPRNRSLTPPPEHDDMMDTALGVAAGLGFGTAEHEATRSARPRSSSPARKQSTGWSFAKLGPAAGLGHEESNRDSGVQFESPILVTDQPSSNRDSGFISAEPLERPKAGQARGLDISLRPPRPQSPTSSTEDVSYNRKQKSHKDETSNLETPRRQPTPVDSTSKERSSVLFNSSPAVLTPLKTNVGRLSPEPVSSPLRRSPSIHGHHHSREELKQKGRVSHDLDTKDTLASNLLDRSAKAEVHRETFSPGPDSAERGFLSNRMSLNTIREDAVDSTAAEGDFHPFASPPPPIISPYPRGSRDNLKEGALSSRDSEVAHAKSLGKSKSRTSSLRNLRANAASPYDAINAAAGPSHIPVNDNELVGSGARDRDMSDIYVSTTNKESSRRVLNPR